MRLQQEMDREDPVAATATSADERIAQRLQVVLHSLPVGRSMLASEHVLSWRCIAGGGGEGCCADLQLGSALRQLQDPGQAAHRCGLGATASTTAARQHASHVPRPLQRPLTRRGPAVTIAATATAATAADATRGLMAIRRRSGRHRRLGFPGSRVCRRWLGGGGVPGLRRQRFTVVGC